MEQGELTEHELSLRKAVDYIKENEICWSVVLPKTDDIQDLYERRERSFADFWGRSDLSIDTINASDLSASQFREEYQEKNLPCLIKGLDPYFETANDAWRNGGARHWFAQVMGDHEVPVRQQQEHTIDEQGRVSECKTLMMTVDEWLKRMSDSPSLYLKDFHLQKWLEDNWPDLAPLYELPPFFDNDILNPFLRKFTGGDYCFVYWGPRCSTTEKHSDVLHSYSWSYNVEGVKEWIFYGTNDRETRLIQRSGECVFVPATWRHRVVNLEETLSINHNWITAYNVDLTWECLRQEMIDIADELGGWKIDDVTCEENMLRGWVGFDLTSFVLMILLRLHQLYRDNGGPEDHRVECKETKCLLSILQKILRQQSDVEERLKARVGLERAKYISEKILALLAS